jgi:hypothetical protein
LCTVLAFSSQDSASVLVKDSGHAGMLKQQESSVTDTV